MKYIIEKKVNFRPNDGTFWLEDRENEKIILPPIVSRLLTVLLEEQGKILPREEIMERVWTIHGLEPSGNSLNQYISNLRSNFRNMGLGDELIKTVPRIGFVFNCEIIIERELITPVIRPLSYNDNPPSSVVKHEPSRSSFFYILLIICSVLVATPLMVSYGVEILSERRMEDTSTLIGKINQCNVRAVKMQNVKNYPMILSVAQKIFDARDIRCQSGETVLLFIQSSIFQDAPGRIFISVCQSHQGMLTSCKNNSFNDWH